MVLEDSAFPLGGPSLTVHFSLVTNNHFYLSREKYDRLRVKPTKKAWPYGATNELNRSLVRRKRVPSNLLCADHSIPPQCLCPSKPDCRGVISVEKLLRIVVNPSIATAGSSSFLKSSHTPPNIDVKALMESVQEAVAIVDVMARENNSNQREWELMNWALQQAYKEVEARWSDFDRIIFSGEQLLAQLRQSYEALVL
ncbi:hypothetical protein PVK06_024073 [Gossypium arboreum]|uniref:Uncharacterized protein n=1 Tax=Gossypium arboreum TaxID=29729 RepID=A0ABR0PCU4_GOSAR|nr:hypothetical protein PVK06_024073 [Gossypium arboreum]